jgi:methylenetetrahydrofolate dehydrogenase (NADP+) / methenyltetrahydrofolate cyclohydrolase
MKEALRVDLKNRISTLTSDVVKKKSHQIYEHLISLDVIKNAKNIALYSSIGNEVETHDLISFFIKTGKHVFLPRVSDTKLIFKRIESFKDLEKGFCNILEPKQECPDIKPEHLDVVVVPCLAVDIHGNRLGKGGGFYDRFLATVTRAIRICLAYDIQILNHVKTEKHDEKVHMVVAPYKVIDHRFCKLLDGAKLARRILTNLKQKVEDHNIRAKLSVILVGGSPASLSYVQSKKQQGNFVGFDVDIVKFDETVTQEALVAVIKKLNKDFSVTGILVQLPLPKHIEARTVLDAVAPEKDVDGLSTASNSKLTLNDETLACCTPKGIIKLLDECKVSLVEKKVVLVGHGVLVGKPLALMLKNRGVTFTICDKNTENLIAQTKDADIIICATGVPGLITRNHVKKGAIVIDAGTRKVNGKIVGDVDFHDVKDKVAWITPVPGGVGPMTVAMLLENLKSAYLLQNSTSQKNKKGSL